MDILSNSIPSLHSRPSLHPEHCLNRVQRRTPCTACADICPHGVFPLKPGEALDWARCTDCTLCVAACPTRALIASEPVRRTWEEAASEKEALRLSCRREDERGNLRVGCLASIPWELTAALALRGELHLYTRACEDCPHTAQKTLLSKNLEKLESFLGTQRYQQQIRLNGEPGTVHTAQETDDNKPMTRRALFSGMKHSMEKQLVKEAGKRLPLLLGQREDALSLRLALSEAVQADRLKSPERSYGMQLPRYNLNCFGCGICATICPHQAISIVPEEGGTRLVYIEPKACTACGLCVSLCPHKGLDGLETVMVPHLEKLALVRVKSESCKRCGAVLLPGTEPGLCRRCAAEAKKRNRI